MILSEQAVYGTRVVRCVRVQVNGRCGCLGNTAPDDLCRDAVHTRRIQCLSKCIVLLTNQLSLSRLLGWLRLDCQLGCRAHG